MVFYANALKFFGRAVVNATSVCDLRPARLDDMVDITSQLADVGKASLNRHQQALRGREVLAEARISTHLLDTIGTP